MSPQKLVGLKKLLKERNYREAHQQALILLESFPASVALLSIAASACYGLTNFSEAKDLLERALRIQPGSEVLEDSLAKVKKKLG